MQKEELRDINAYSLSTEQVLDKLETKDVGITSADAERRLQIFGKNELVSAKKHGKLYRFFSQFKDIMLIILLIAAAVNAVIALVEHVYADLIDVAIIVGIVLINAVIGYIQESKAENALSSLKKMSQPYVRVRRNGVVERILTTDVVPGDIILLEAGDICCADVRLIECASLSCDESSLTGESLQVQKSATGVLPTNTALGDRTNMLYSGTVITYGRGYGVVVATGMDTEIGKIAGLLNASQEETTPIQQKLAHLGKIISIVVLSIAVILFVINVAVKSSHDVIDALMIAIAIAVAAIPESLPAVITIIMSLGVSRMSKQRAIIRKMHAVETLGSCQIICSDKTGTLTQNKMQVQSVYIDGKMFDATEFDTKHYKDMINCIALCNDCEQSDRGFLGDPTEIALVEFAESRGHKQANMQQNFVRVAELPFDSNRKMMTTFNKVSSKVIGYTKGAPDILLDRCTKVLYNGSVVNLTKAIKEKILAGLEQMSSKGLRTLGHAYKEHKGQDYSLGNETNMVFLGIVGMRDPPRPEAKDAVATCIEAGMRPIMITGDYATTAKEIAREVGIYRDGDMVLTGAELDKLNDAEYRNIIEKVSVYARVSPENKVRIVETWKSLDKVVAMTGDGVNDAPSIKRADIGVGMGINGTEVTKEVADMVLTDDNFATIITAVREGRTTYQNIKKVIQFLFGTNLVEVATILIVTLFMPELTFLSALQILFINLVTDTLPAISLSVEKSEKDIMRQPPRDKKEGLFVGVLPTMITQFVWQTALIIALFVIVYNMTNDNVLATTMAFVALSIFQLMHIINLRTTHSIFTTNLFTNWVFWLTFVGGIIINIALVSIAPVANVFGLTPLSVTQWLILFALAFSIIPVIELQKLITRAIVTRKGKRH